MAVVDRQKATRTTIVEWIEHILERKKWTGTDLARNAKMAPSTILRLMNDPKHTFIPTLATLQKIADTSGYPIPRKVTEVLGAPKMEPHPASGAGEDLMKTGSRRQRGVNILDQTSNIPLQVISTLPSKLHSATKPNGDLTVLNIPQLVGDDTAFAFHMPDNSLEPYVKASALMYASKRRDPQVNDIVLLVDKEGRSRVRLLKEIDERGITLFTPAKDREETVEFDNIDTVAYVVATVCL
jgi:transcriptional regulator with XRE-family HTH domain